MRRIRVIHCQYCFPVVGQTAVHADEKRSVAVIAGFPVAGEVKNNSYRRKIKRQLQQLTPEEGSK